VIENVLEALKDPRNVSISNVTNLVNLHQIQNFMQSGITQQMPNFHRIISHVNQPYNQKERLAIIEEIQRFLKKYYQYTEKLQAIRENLERGTRRRIR